MTELSPVPPVSTFVIRLWREWSAGGARWRGRIEHIQSRESTAFVDLDEMLNFLRCFGVMAEDENLPASEHK